ncbi:Uncharacterised protein [Bordetella pertussis]|nr:Uncharacterised protein [Bordetella pertussis]
MPSGPRSAPRLAVRSSAASRQADTRGLAVRISQARVTPSADSSVGTISVLPGARPASASQAG